MFELKIKNSDGDIYELTNNPKYTIYKIEGLDPVKATINKTSNTTTTGDTINSVKAESRNIVIYLTINGDIEGNRINLYKYCPVEENVTLYFKNGARDVYIEGVVEDTPVDPFSAKETVQISIVCPKTYFRGIDYVVNSFSDISSLFRFPFAIAKEGIPFSEITTNLRKSIINTGDVITGVKIKLFATGSVVNPVIYNVMTGEKLAFNFTMQASDTLEIDTNVGSKSIQLVRNGVTSNAMGYRTPDSKWFTLKSGDNVFTYDAVSGNSNLQITFTNETLYKGV